MGKCTHICPTCKNLCRKDNIQHPFHFCNKHGIWPKMKQGKMIIKLLQKNQCEKLCPECGKRCLEDKGHNVKKRKHVCIAHTWPK